jgi:hypothetical protein
VLRKMPYLALLCLINNSCTIIKDARTCSVAGVLSAGGICSHMISPETNDLSFNEFLDFLSAQPERTCVPVIGMNVCADDQSQGVPVKLPARAAAIVMSSDDWGTKKTELEVACRELGSRCSYETLQFLKRLK